MKPLRLLLPLVFFCCLFNSSRAQYVTIPDTAFVSWLQTNVPACMNGNQMDTDCSPLTTTTIAFIENKPVKDLTGIQYFDGLTELQCNGDLIDYIPAFPPNLTRLSLGGNRLTSLPDLPQNLNVLYVNNNWLINLPALPASLRLLHCEQNQLTSLPALPPLLGRLSCANTLLTTLPTLPDSLTELFTSYCALTSLPSLPNNLRFLDCMENNLTVIPPLNPSLRTLKCGNAQLMAIPSPLPDSLTGLECYGGTFTTLPVLPQSLAILNVGNIPLTSLPALPSGLVSLGVSSTPLSTLPALPSGLQGLYCSNNQLTALPVLPDSLNVLACSFNQLTSLPIIPRLLDRLYCDNNLLTFIAELPDSMNTFSCYANPYLHCLPQLKTIVNLYFDDSTIVCLPSYGKVTFSSPLLNTKPLCNPFNSNGCPLYWNVSGNVYHDISANCLQQTGETNIPYLKVNLWQSGNLLQQAYTAQSGVYSFDAGFGNYKIIVDTTGIPFTVKCPLSGFDSADITPVDSLASGRNFALQCKPGFDIAVQSVSSYTVFRPARFNTIKIKAGDAARFYRQSCNTLNLSGQLVTSISGQLHYVSPAPGALTPTTVQGNILTYNISNWAAIDPETAFNVITQTDTTAQGGTFACFNVTVTPSVGDNFLQNNTYNFCFPIVNSYDPNDKSVYPVSNVDITGDHWLTYTVRFQNTGNAPAEHIYITDTIDTDVDIETFQLLAYSFAPQVIIKGNAVRFNFANINLPDSVNDEPNSHGYVQYKVKVKDNATVGTVINNTAFIYFDFNAPVVTNTTTNTLTLPNGITTVAGSTATMQVYPNPANDIVMINMSDNLTGGTLTLSDVTGRSLNTIAITSTHNQINTGALSSGVYLVTAIKGGERVVQRLVVSK